MTPEPTINHDDAVAFFRQLLDDLPTIRIIRLLGDGKMGKSHLVTRIFPRLIDSARARHAVLDLRNQTQSPIDFLQIACSQLEGASFPQFDQAHEEWLNRPKVNASGIQSLLSVINISSRSDDKDTERFVPLLTRKFVDDLRDLHDRQIIFLFDAVDVAAPAVQHWLMDDLLVRLAKLPHVRVVVAGRQLAEPAGGYATICQSHELIPVRDPEEYIRFCRVAQIMLTEQSIRDFAHAVNYAPGQFIDLIKAFPRRGAAHG